jgi:RimJ/RimL family protein N-acetyltransferase
VISESILHGEKVRLRPVVESDLPRFAEWLQDAEVTRWLAAISEPPALEDEYEWWQEKRSDPDTLLWSIDTLDGELVGNVELRLSPANRRGELGIAIQDKSRWGQGLGTDAVLAVLDYAFAELGLNRVELTTDEANTRALRCYERCGFVREGLLRQHRLTGGGYSDTVVMALLREDWLRLKDGGS